MHEANEPRILCLGRRNGKSRTIADYLQWAFESGATDSPPQGPPEPERKLSFIVDELTLKTQGAPE